MARSEYEIFNTSTSSGVAGMRPMLVLLRRGPRTDLEESVLDAYIRACCRRFQRRWSASTERLRRGGSEPAYSFPCYRGGVVSDDGVTPLDALSIGCEGDAYR